MHRQITPALVAALVSLLAAACSSDADPATTAAAPTADSTTVPPSEPVPASTAAPTGGPRQIEVDVGGRTLSGRCNGTAEPGRPTVILEPGLGNTADQLASLEFALSGELLVCSYDRAGLGDSDPPDGPRTLSALVADLDSFIAGGGLAPPFVLVGQSLGANIAFRYAQTNPSTVVGFVAMNPVPPYTTWIEQAATVQTPDELQDNEVRFFQGGNDEGIDLTDTDLMLDEPMPDEVRFTVMFAEDCPGDFCDRIRPVLAAATEQLAHVGAGGAFVAVPGAGHEIFTTHRDTVDEAIRQLLV